jgi:HK97 gp10 family phage protein
MKMTTHVSGLADLDRALQDMTKATARNAVRRALRAAGAPIYTDMVANAPPHIKDSVEIGDKLTSRQAKLNNRSGNKANVEVFVGVSYKLGQKGRTAHLFEFGTRMRYRSSGGYTGRIAAQPFVRPAWDQNQGKALGILKDAMWKEIGKATERARRKAAREAARAARGGA